MSETQQPKDLTAQLAQWVLVEWTRAHNNCSLWNTSGSARCDGTFAGCNFPKPAALVAYEQGQAERFPGNDLSALSCRCPAKRGEDCPLTSDECLERSVHAKALPNQDFTCQICHDLRADGAGEQAQPQASDNDCPACGTSAVMCRKFWRDGCSVCCAKCPHRTREAQEASTPSQPAQIYILIRFRADEYTKETEEVRAYMTEARANEDSDLLQQCGASQWQYRVHTVPLVKATPVNERDDD